MMGYIFADSVAAVIVGFMIVRMGAVFAWEAVQELIDTGLSIEEVEQHPPGHHRYTGGRQPA